MKKIAPTMIKRIVDHLRKSELKRCVDCIHNKQITHYKFIENKVTKCNTIDVCKLFHSENIHRKKTSYLHSLDARLDENKCGVEGKYFIQRVPEDIAHYSSVLDKTRPWHHH